MSRNFFGKQPGFDEPFVTGSFSCRSLVIGMVKKNPFGTAGMSGQHFYGGLWNPDEFGQKLDTHLVGSRVHRWCRKPHFKGITVDPFDAVS